MKIEDIGEVISIDDLRSRIGSGKSDINVDNDIESMDPLELVKEWTAYNIGSASWAIDIIEAYEALKEIQAKEE